MREKPSLSERFADLAHIFLVFASYLFLLLPVLRDPGLLPSHDNLKYHLPNYMYFSGSLAHGYGLPLWYPTFGGTPVGITSVSLFPLMPHRVLGYLLYLLLPMDVISLYKATLVAGMLLIGAGWWLFLRRLTGSRAGATFGALMVLLGGSGITILHQEQIIATMTYTPWIMLALFEARKNLNYLVVFAAFLGFAVTTHYPQIAVLSFLFLIISLALCGFIKWHIVKSAWDKKPLLLAAFAVFILASSPALYIYASQGDFSSPVRGTEKIEISSYDEYIAVNKMQVSSSPFGYLTNYLKPKTDPRLIPNTEVFDDRFTFFVTRFGLFMAAVAMVFKPRHALAGLLTLALAGWASTGINGQLAQGLYLLKFPFIRYFRQWYHFAPMINFALSALGAIGFSALIELSLKRLNPEKKALKGLISGALIVAASGLMFAEGYVYFKDYVKYNLPESRSSWQKPDRREYLSFISSGALERGEPIMTYTDWFRLYKACPDALWSVPFAARAAFNDINMNDEGRPALIKAFCDGGLPAYAVMASIPPGAPLPPSFYDLQRLALEKHRAFPPEAFLLTPFGAVLEGYSEGASLVVLPFSRSLGLRVAANDQPAETFPVYGGAMTGIIPPAGRFGIKLSMPYSAYQLAVFIQYALILSIAAYLLLRSRLRKPEGQTESRA